MPGMFITLCGTVRESFGDRLLQVLLLVVIGAAFLWAVWLPLPKARVDAESRKRESTQKVGDVLRDPGAGHLLVLAAVAARSLSAGRSAHFSAPVAWSSFAVAR